MTKRDKHNLKVLLQGDTPDLRKFWKEASQDDKEYCLDLLMRAAGKRRDVMTAEGMRTVTIH